MIGKSRNRGREVTRIEAFVDAAFAFAVTLLVISLDVPDNAQAMIEALKGVPAFAASFSLLAMIWWAHASWSRSYGLDDGRSVMRSEEHTSEIQSLMRISYAVFRLKKKKKNEHKTP